METMQGKPIKGETMQGKTTETFADIVNRLVPRNISLAKLSREADIEYSYFHSLMNGRRKSKDAPEGDEGRVLRPSPDKGMSTLSALERMGVIVSTEDRERMITACLPVPAGYRLISDERLLEERPEAGTGSSSLRFVGKWSQMDPDEQRLLADIIEAWAEKKQKERQQSEEADE